MLLECLQYITGKVDGIVGMKENQVELVPVNLLPLKKDFSFDSAAESHPICQTIKHIY